jgi:hypothetical protein
VTPKRPDEIALMRETLAQLDREAAAEPAENVELFIRALILPIGPREGRPYERIGMHPNRAAHIHRKWCRWGWVDFDVSELCPLWLEGGHEKLRAALADLGGDRA